MADDWIKKRKKLIDDPRTVALANRLNTTGQHILGCLDLLWSLADSFADPETGLLKGYSAALVDQKVRHPGFAEACAACTRNHPDGAWLILRKTGVIFPEYGSHNGKTAKVRAQTAKRVAKFRESDVTQDVTHQPLPDQTRPEKIRKEKQPPTTNDDVNAVRAFAHETFGFEWPTAVVRNLLVDFGLVVVVELLDHLASRLPSERFNGIENPVGFIKSLAKKAKSAGGERGCLGRSDHEYEPFENWRARRDTEIARVA